MSVYYGGDDGLIEKKCQWLPSGMSCARWSRKSRFITLFRHFYLSSFYQHSGFVFHSLPVSDLSFFLLSSPLSLLFSLSLSRQSIFVFLIQSLILQALHSNLNRSPISSLAVLVRVVWFMPLLLMLLLLFVIVALTFLLLGMFSVYSFRRCSPIFIFRLPHTLFVNEFG